MMGVRIIDRSINVDMEIADHKYDDGVITMKVKMLIPEEGGWSGAQAQQQYQQQIMLSAASKAYWQRIIIY